MLRLLQAIRDLLTRVQSSPENRNETLYYSAYDTSDDECDPDFSYDAATMDRGMIDCRVNTRGSEDSGDSEDAEDVGFDYDSEPSFYGDLDEVPISTPVRDRGQQQWPNTMRDQYFGYESPLQDLYIILTQKPTVEYRDFGYIHPILGIIKPRRLFHPPRVEHPPPPPVEPKLYFNASILTLEMLQTPVMPKNHPLFYLNFPPVSSPDMSLVESDESLISEVCEPVVEPRPLPSRRWSEPDLRNQRMRFLDVTW